MKKLFITLTLILLITSLSALWDDYVGESFTRAWMRITGVLYLADGSAAAPSLAATDHTTTGLYWTASLFGITLNGTAKFYISSSNATFVTNLLPSISMTYTCGSSTRYWKEGRFGDNPANTNWTGVHLLNGDEGATGETGQTADIEFEMQGTINGGTAHTIQQAAKISAYKISDYFHASDETDNDAGLKFYGVTDGSYVEALDVRGDYIEPKVDMKFNKITAVEDGGVISLIDMSVSATPTQGTKERYTFDMDGNDAMHIGGFADSAGDVVAPHVGFDAPLHFGWHQFVDNFMWQSGAYTTIWDVTTFDNDGGTGSNDVVAGAGLGGLVQLKSDDANTECECSATQGKYFGRAIQSIATIHLRVDATTALAGCEVLFGFSDDPMTEGGEHVCFLFDYSDDADQWQTKTVDGTDVSLAAGANPTAGTFQELRIVLETNGTAHFIVDEVWYASITEAIDNDGEMYLFFGVRSEGAAFETIDVGGIWAAWTHN